MPRLPALPLIHAFHCAAGCDVTRADAMAFEELAVERRAFLREAQAFLTPRLFRRDLLDHRLRRRLSERELFGSLVDFCLFRRKQRIARLDFRLLQPVVFSLPRHVSLDARLILRNHVSRSAGLALVPNA